MRGVEKEAADWASRSGHAREQSEQAALKLKAMPQRFKETPREVRRKLAELLAERRDLTVAMATLEANGVQRVEALRGELEALRRDLRAASEQLSEARRNRDFWIMQGKVERARSEVRKGLPPGSSVDASSAPHQTHLLLHSRCESACSGCRRT